MSANGSTAKGIKRKEPERHGITASIGRLEFGNVPFGLSFVFPHRPRDNTTREKVLDRASYGNRQQLDRVCNCTANVTARLYSGKPVLHLRVCVQYAVVAEGTKHAHIESRHRIVVSPPATLPTT